MYTALLRSGSLRDYSPIGEDGVTVISVASQFRDTIRLKLGKDSAAYLANPQRNAKGDVIDWYIPFESTRSDGDYRIIPWTSTSDDEKNEIYHKLELFRDKLLALCENLTVKEDQLEGDQKLFYRLLYDKNNTTEYAPEKLRGVYFPGNEYVYLVNGQPVITFWGFNKKDNLAIRDPFLCLKPAEKKPEVMEKPEVESSKPVAPVVGKPFWLRWWFWLLWFLFGLLLLLFFLWPYLFAKSWHGLDDLDLTKLDLNKIDLAKLADQGIIKTQDELKVGDEVKQSIIYRRGTPVGVVGQDGKYNYFGESNLLTGLNTRPAATDNPALTAAEETKPAGEDSTLPPDGAAKPDAENPALTAAEETKPAGEDSTLPPDGAAKPDAENPALTPAEETKPAGEDSTLPPDGAAKPDAEKPALTPAEETKPVGENPAIPKADVANPALPSKNKTDLAIPPEALKTNDLSFFTDKQWQGSGLQDANGNPLKLNYAIDKDGKGVISMKRADGVECKSNLTTKMQNGQLKMAANAVASCSDNSSYKLPNVSCSNQNGKTRCYGDNGDGKKFPFMVDSQVK